MIKLIVIVAALTAVAAASGAEAHTEEENLDFINMIVSFLNNREKCTLPSYAEVDELARSFEDLKQVWGLEGQEFEQRLSADQRLLRETILDQWDSFQKYLTSENVLKSAKKRSFLGKVENYQEQKFGESICTKRPDTGVLDDPEFEKNPLVRYVKQFGRTGKALSSGRDNGSSNGPAASANFDNDVELKFKVHDRDASGKIKSSKNYVTKFNFDSSRPQNRITLHIGTQD